MSKESSNENLVKIFVGGRGYDVPSGLTIMQAMEYVGYKFIRGSGCRGGFCGACASIYRITGKRRIETNLICQKTVEEGMNILIITPTLSGRTIYDINKLRPTNGVLMENYPEIAKCLSCNTCSKACPQDIEVMDFVQAAIKGDIEKTAKLSFECVECGLCAIRCPAGISPHHIARLARRLFAKYISRRSKPLAERVKEIEEGVFDDELDRYEMMEDAELKKLYAKLHKE